MTRTPISVLVVDDSAMMRSLVGRIMESDPRTSLAGKAMNGLFALRKIESLHPEVIILDLEMPEMNGIEFLRERKKRGIDIPVIVLSSIAKRGAQVTMEALALGASDFVLKPSGSVSTDIHVVADHLVELVASLGTVYRARHGTPAADQSGRERSPAPAIGDAAGKRKVIAASADPYAPPPPEITRPSIKPGPIEIVAIGISTGGPNALRKLFAQIDADLAAPVVVVQHMPPGFTAEFAKSLDRVSPLKVKEAADGDFLTPGEVLIAPGDHHVSVDKSRGTPRVSVHDGPPRNGHRPSVDVLFASVAEQYGPRGLGVIMTGMGKDGAQELGAILRKGGLTIGQDAGSSVVYGMPRVAQELGHVQLQVSLPEMADTIARLVKENQ